MKTLSLLLFLLCFSVFGKSYEGETFSVKPKNRFTDAVKHADSLFWADTNNWQELRRIYEDTAKVEKIHKDLFENLEERRKETEKLKLELWEHN